MIIATENEFIRKIGEFRLGIITAEILECEESSQQLIELIQQHEAQIKNTVPLDMVNKIPMIKATREAYKKLGNDPNRYRPSADSLIRRIVKGLGLYYINTVVDVLNLVSIHSGFSIGGYDTKKIEGEVILGIGRKNELYHGIGRGKLNIRNLPVLRDDLGAFGTPTSDSERTRITTSTRALLFVFYDFEMSDDLSLSMDYCTGLLKEYGVAKNLFSEIIDFPKLA